MLHIEAVASFFSGIEQNDRISQKFQGSRNKWTKSTLWDWRTRVVMLELLHWPENTPRQAFSDPKKGKCGSHS